MKTLNLIASTLLLGILFYSCDKNEFAPEILDQDFVVSENSPSGSTVGTVVATDVDGPTLSYEIVDGNEDRVFTIDASSGKLSVDNNENLDYESTMLYVLQVVVSDNHNKDPLESSADMRIEVTDANEFAPKIPNMVNQTFSISEDSQIGTQLGVVEATDEDSEQTLSYSIKSGNESGIFAINTENGIITVADNSTLNYETTVQYLLTVAVADDHQDNPLESTASLQVDVLDVNEFTPEIESGNFTLDENPVNDQVIGQVIATDGDIHQGLTYHITWQDENNYFGIDSLTGILVVADSSGFDFESAEQITLQVQVTDDHKNSRAQEAIITITINDVLEITDGLVAHLPFDGNVEDSWGDFNGTPYNVSYVPNDQNSGNEYLSLSGQDSYVTLSDPFDFESISINFSFKARSAGSNLGIIYSSDNPELLHGLTLISVKETAESGTELYFNFSDKLDTVEIEKDKWYNVTMVRAGQVYSYYLDGELIGSGEIESYVSSYNGSPFSILGSVRTMNNNFFDGLLENLRIYKRAIPQEEIKKLF